MIFGDQYSPKSSSFSATLTLSTILATSRSAFNKGELSREDDERSGDAAPYPGDHARTRDDLLAKQRGQQPVGGEDDKREEHEHCAQQKHPRHRVSLVRTDELGQECEEEKRELGVEEVDEDGGQDDPACRALGAARGDRERPAFADRRPRDI